MGGCEFIFTSPDRSNIFYKVRFHTDIEFDMELFVLSLKTHLVQSPKVFVYCQSLNTCMDLSFHFTTELGDSRYYPAGDEKKQSPIDFLECFIHIQQRITRKHCLKV